MKKHTNSEIKELVKSYYKNDKIVDIDVSVDNDLDIEFIFIISISKNHIAWKHSYTYDKYNGLRFFKTEGCL